MSKETTESKQNGIEFQRTAFPKESFIPQTEEEAEFTALEPRDYLDLALIDYNYALSAKNDLNKLAPAVTVSLASTLEKCLSHLLMLKGVQFIPTHKSVNLLDKVEEVYDDFPQSVNKVICTLCTSWYYTNRYPQMAAKGYENFYLILAVMSELEVLIQYCVEQTDALREQKPKYERYQLYRSLKDANVVNPVNPDSE